MIHLKARIVSINLTTLSLPSYPGLYLYFWCFGNIFGKNGWWNSLKLCNVVSIICYVLCGLQSAVLPVNVPLDVRVSCSEPQSAQWWPGSWEMWAQSWQDLLSKDTGRWWWCLMWVLGAITNGALLPATGRPSEWASGHQQWLATTNPCRSYLLHKWTLVAILYSEGNSLWWDNNRKKMWCGWFW